MSLENKTDINCEYYNWGGDGTKERPSYPKEYGARCEYYAEFFSRDDKDILRPNCSSCQGK